MRSHRSLWRRTIAIIAVSAALVSAAAQNPETPAAATSAAPQLAQFKAAGRDAAVSVYPAGLIGRPVRQVGDVVALMLERAGMPNIEIDAPEFNAPEKADLAETARAFGEFVRANPPKTDYALFADFVGSRENGFQEVRTVITNRQGEPVWQDRQTAADADFKRIRPKEPMQCCQLVVERLRPVLALDDPTRQSAPEGKLARHWRDNSGVPSKDEQAALEERQRVFKNSAATATLLVYPSLAGDESSKDSATHLAQLLNEATLSKVSVIDQGPELKVKGNMNEQKTLWDMARGVREFVQTHRPNADYVLYAHYLMGKDAAGNVAVGGVHFVVCDQDGRWVVVDFQNNHHQDFNAIDPKSREACDQVVARRLKTYCR